MIWLHSAKIRRHPHFRRQHFAAVMVGKTPATWLS